MILRYITDKFIVAFACKDGDGPVADLQAIFTHHKGSLGIAFAPLFMAASMKLLRHLYASTEDTSCFMICLYCLSRYSQRWLTHFRACVVDKSSFCAKKTNGAL